MRLQGNYIKILKALQKNKFLHSKGIAEAVGIDNRNINRYLINLKDKKYITKDKVPAKWAQENPRQAGIARFWRLTKIGEKILKDLKEKN